MICSWKFKKDFVILNVALDFVLLVLKLRPIQVVISLLLRIKLTMGQLLLFFLCNSSSFCSYVGSILVTNHFSLLFWSVVIFSTASEDLPSWSWQQKVTKTASKSFSPSNFCHFLLFWCMLGTATTDIPSSSENINSMACISRLSFHFLWLCFLWSI